MHYPIEGKSHGRNINTLLILAHTPAVLPLNKLERCTAIDCFILHFVQDKRLTENFAKLGHIPMSNLKVTMEHRRSSV